MNKEETKDELYYNLMEAAKHAKELGEKEIFEAIMELKSYTITLLLV